MKKDMMKKYETEKVDLKKKHEAQLATQAAEAKALQDDLNKEIEKFEAKNEDLFE